MTNVNLRHLLRRSTLGLVKSSTPRLRFWLVLAAALQYPCQAGATTCDDDPDMVKIPAGEFIMGSDRRERDYAYTIGSEAARKFRWYDRWELNRSFKYLPDYHISRKLTTQKNYQQFVLATGHRIPSISESEYRQQGYVVHPYEEVKKYVWSNAGENTRPQYKKRLALHPVVLVSYFDAASYCRWHGSSRGADYRVPTEAEWEKAARGVGGNYFPWGDQLDSARLNFNYIYQGTTAVGKFVNGVSPFDALDMAGNVFEWTSTRFDQDKMTLKGGGSWDDQGGISRAASRHGRVHTARHILFGFRCVCSES